MEQCKWILSGFPYSVDVFVFLAHLNLGCRINLSEFGTIDHDLHRMRRAPVARFFSRGNVAKLEGEIKEHVQMLCDKLLRQIGKVPFDVKTAYSCFTADVISCE